MAERSGNSQEEKGYLSFPTFPKVKACDGKNS